MIKLFTVILLFIVVFSITSMAFAMSRFKPVPMENAQNNPMHFEFEQNPEQTFSLNCNWYPTCPAQSSEPCVWLKDSNQKGVIHV